LYPSDGVERDGRGSWDVEQYSSWQATAFRNPTLRHIGAMLRLTYRTEDSIPRVKAYRAFETLFLRFNNCFQRHDAGPSIRSSFGPSVVADAFARAIAVTYVQQKATLVHVCLYLRSVPRQRRELIQRRHAGRRPRFECGDFLEELAVSHPVHDEIQCGPVCGMCKSVVSLR